MKKHGGNKFALVADSSVEFGGHHDDGHHGASDYKGGYSYLETVDLELTQTDNGNEFTIDSDSVLNILSATLDDVSGDSDAIIVNFSEVDGDTQTVSGLKALGIENIVLNIVADETNDTDDNVILSRLIVDDLNTLSVVSEESVSIGRMQASSLETIDLTGATAGFEIGHTHSQNAVTYIIDTIGDGVGNLNLDIDADGVLDTSASSIELNNLVQDTLDFSSTSLESDLIVTRFEVDSDDVYDDVIDLSSLGITSIDDLIFTESDYVDYGHCSSTSTDTMITSDSFEGSIILAGISSSDLDATNFLFA
jgi:hypothetical protein